MSDTELEILIEQTDHYVIAFRWLWVSNCLAAFVGIVWHRYELAFVSGLSTMVALVGAALARRSKKTIAKAMITCKKVSKEVESAKAA